MKHSKEVIDYIRSISKGRYRQEIADMTNAKFNMNLTVNSIKHINRWHKISTGINGCKKGDCLGYKTIFKKGSKPVNTHPIGTEKLRDDGYIWVKVNDNPGQHNIAKRWITRGRKVYMDHNPNIILTDEDRVLHLDGDKLNDTIDNLYLVDKKIMAQLCKNGLITEFKEITKTNVNIVKLQQLINRRQKK